MIQLRDKLASARDLYQAVVQSVEYAHSRDVKIIVNDRADIALAAKADGVHLGQDDLSPAHARKLLGEDAIIGFSTHSVDQARSALALPLDYVAVGPIFATSTKSDHDPIVGLEGLRRVRELSHNIHLVAIGGINRQNAGSVLASGANSVAVISDAISEPSQITFRMQELLRV